SSISLAQHVLCASVQPEEFSREGSLCGKKLKKRRQTLGRPSQAQFPTTLVAPVIGTMTAAPYVDKIIKGANPANLPVEQPMKFQVVLNMKTARAPGLTVSRTLPAR